MSFIHHSLMLLEDAGMSVGYPEISLIAQDGGQSSFSSGLQGRRVSIEQNPHLKLVMMFSLLDFHVDTMHPGMEGKSYRQKYMDLPVSGDYDLMLRELFRVAKVMRNALVHNPSSFSIANKHVNIDYTHGKTNFRVEMSLEALAGFYTAIVMYLKGDMGRGNYFLGIMRSIYSNMLLGIKGFNDDFDNALEVPLSGIKMKWHTRLVHLNSQHQISEGRIHILAPNRELQPWEGLDFHIARDGDDFLIPREALGEDLSISELDLINNWKREGHFPRLEHP
ncbi:hypothetical protein [Burkholderia gladioli]|uniref:hypothetical protein n=2 Tax=Burkholderia gladioli TaxID=28095 RepID=UPI0015E79A38|nr:hypothetical protein [Burkholderia gladioli]MBA1364894.1 hypothetical protein [Burkholderia gladioli]